eukprot:gnl/Chilomastix_cuspidata/2037.p1 GENE.gnl/Chilomastix_cuspidata/2037~~gnl/Chilomastix_cuspidata/2037.p1  ORF type:complete len:709 (+),score=82.94 gnl/Chilomastix_cuspidata/2037:147-2273(+)
MVVFDDSDHSQGSALLDNPEEMGPEDSLSEDTSRRVLSEPLQQRHTLEDMPNQHYSEGDKTYPQAYLMNETPPAMDVIYFSGQCAVLSSPVSEATSILLNRVGQLKEAPNGTKLSLYILDANAGALSIWLLPNGGQINFLYPESPEHKNLVIKIDSRLLKTRFGPLSRGDVLAFERRGSFVDLTVNGTFVYSALAAAFTQISVYLPSCLAVFGDPPEPIVPLLRLLNARTWTTPLRPVLEAALDMSFRDVASLCSTPDVLMSVLHCVIMSPMPEDLRGFRRAFALNDFAEMQNYHTLQVALGTRLLMATAPPQFAAFITFVIQKYAPLHTQPRFPVQSGVAAQLARVLATIAVSGFLDDLPEDRFPLVAALPELRAVTSPLYTATDNLLFTLAHAEAQSRLARSSYEIVNRYLDAYESVYLNPHTAVDQYVVGRLRARLHTDQWGSYSQLYIYGVTAFPASAALRKFTSDMLCGHLRSPGGGEAAGARPVLLSQLTWSKLSPKVAPRLEQHLRAMCVNAQVTGSFLAHAGSPFLIGAAACAAAVLDGPMLPSHIQPFLDRLAAARPHTASLCIRALPGLFGKQLAAEEQQTFLFILFKFSLEFSKLGPCFEGFLSEPALSLAQELHGLVCGEEPSETEVGDDIDCSICFSAIRVPVRLNCGHTFCANCFMDHLRENSTRCPLCRAQTTTITFVELEALVVHVPKSLEA